MVGFSNVINLHPYVAFDMETTGANPDFCEILEMAAIYDDGTSPIDELKTFRVLVRPQDGYFKYSEPFAMQMPSNQALLTEIQKGGGLIEKDALEYFADWLDEVLTMGHGNAFAGKNFAAFDGPILKRRIAYCKARSRLNRFGYRSIDIGSLFFPEFGYVPDSKELKQIIKSPSSDVEHRALADAFDVVRAVRKRMEV